MNMLCKIWFFVGITVENKKMGLILLQKNVMVYIYSKKIDICRNQRE